MSNRIRPGRILLALLFSLGLVLFGLAAMGRTVGSGWLAFGLTYGLFAFGALGWAVDVYRGTLAGIKNHGTVQNRLQLTQTCTVFGRPGSGWIAVMVPMPGGRGGADDAMGRRDREAI